MHGQGCGSKVHLVRTLGRAESERYPALASPGFIPARSVVISASELMVTPWMIGKLCLGAHAIMRHPRDYTVGWICARQTELVAAMILLDEEQDAPDQVFPNDNNVYKLGRNLETQRRDGYVTRRRVPHSHGDSRRQQPAEQLPKCRDRSDLAVGRRARSTIFV
jgi:hypothetical protein